MVNLLARKSELEGRREAALHNIQSPFDEEAWNKAIQDVNSQISALKSRLSDVFERERHRLLGDAIWTMKNSCTCRSVVNDAA